MHPLLFYWIQGEQEKADKDAYNEGLKTLIVPASQAEQSVFYRLPPNAQTEALSLKRADWKLSPAEVSSLYNNLGAEEARYQTLKVACRLASSSQDAEKTSWQTLINELLTHPPLMAVQDQAGWPVLSDCVGHLPESILSLFDRVAQNPNIGINDLEYFYLSQLPVKNAFKTWALTATDGPTLRRRADALMKIIYETKADLPDAADRKILFRRVLAGSEISLFKELGIWGIQKLKDVDAVELLGSTIVRTPSDDDQVLKEAACAAWALLQDRAELWQGFLTQISSAVKKNEQLQKIAGNPAMECQR